MSEEDRLRQDLRVLEASMQGDWAEYVKPGTTAEEKADIMLHVKWCMTEVAERKDRLEVLKAGGFA